MWGWFEIFTMLWKFMKNDEKDYFGWKIKMKPSFIGKIISKQDRYDPNTRSGMLNRLARMNGEKSFSEKYNFDDETDLIGYKFYKLQDAQFWTNTEMNFSKDIEHYRRADPKVKRALNLILGFFAAGDGLVTSNLVFRFIFEARSMVEMSALIAQAHQEAIHAENYIMTIKSMIPDKEKRKELLESVDNIQCVKDKAILIENYLYADLPMSYRLIAFAATEGISFWALFAVLFYFKDKKDKNGNLLFENIVSSNIQIAKDESMHKDYGCARYRALPMEEKLPQEITFKVLGEFADVEKRFADKILPEPYNDLNAEDIKNFIEYMTDNLCVGLGYDKLYNTDKIPEAMYWMAIGSRSDKANFYEVDVLSYKLRPLCETIHKNKDEEDNDDSSDIDETYF